MDVLKPLAGLSKSQAHDDVFDREAEWAQNRETEADETFADAPTKPPDHRRVKSAAIQIKNTVKQQLQRTDRAPASDNATEIENKRIPGITDNPAFNTGKLFKSEPEGANSVASKAVDKIQKVSRAIAHPRESIKAKAAGKINLDEHPYITKEADAALIQAHKDLEEAESSPYGTSEDDSDSSVHLNRVETIEKDRNNLRNAWVTGKYVKRVRSVPQRVVKFPRAFDYRIYDSNNVYVRLNWQQYAGHFLLWLSQDFSLEYVDPDEDIPFRRGTLIHNAERFFIATAPWQSWLINVRQIYNWDDPWRTGRWFFLWLLLIMTGHIMTFVWTYVAVITLQSRFTKTSSRSLRESHERAINETSQVHKLSELVRKHGDDQWIDPLLEELGPYIQQQLGDLADYLEILINYYHWRNPRATAHTVVFWISCALLTAFTSAEFSLRVFWFVCGIYFFWSRPLASQFPQYRHQLSIFRWIYFNIPTHAELAFSELRVQAQETKDAVLLQRAPNGTVAAAEASKNPAQLSNIPQIRLQDAGDTTEPQLANDTHYTASTDELPLDSEDFKQTPEAQISTTDILSFHGRWCSKPGRLVISTSGVRFLQDYRRRDHTMDFLQSSAPSVRITDQRLEDLQDIDEHDKSRELWSIPYRELVELRKSTPPAYFRNHKYSMGQAEALTICWFEEETEEAERTESNTILPPGENPRAPENNDRIGIGHNPKIHRKMRIETIEHMRKRDEAFNCVIGFSALKFRVLPPLIGFESETAEKAEKLDEDEAHSDKLDKKNVSKSANTAALGVKVERRKRNSVFEELGKM